jgi:uncharacterized protein YyaL (SSP411 family)
VRAKNANDNAVPAGNGTMLANLARLYLLTGEDAYRQRGAALRQAFAGELQRNFFPLGTLLNASELFDHAVQVVVAGAPGETSAEALADAAFTSGNPNLVLQYAPPASDLPTSHPAYGKGPVGGKAAAYVCRAQTCSAPLTDAAALAAELAAKGGNLR